MKPAPIPTLPPLPPMLLQNPASDIYIYGVGIAAVLAIGACAVFAYKKKYSLTLNNKRVKGPVGHMETYKATKKMKHALDMMVKKLYINK